MSLSDEEKIRLLEKRILRLETMIGKGAMAQYLFCPSLNCWLPAQCDDEGRQVIDPSDLDTRYLKLDGSNKMLDDLDLGTEDVIRGILFPNAYLRNLAGAQKSIVQLTNRAGVLNIHLQCYSFGTKYYNASDADTYITAYPASYGHLVLRSYDSDYRIGIDLYNKKVVMPNVPLADPGVAGELWNDGGTLKISAGP